EIVDVPLIADAFFEHAIEIETHDRSLPRPLGICRRLEGRLEAPGHGSLPSPFGRRSDRRAARSRPFVRNRSHARAEVRRTLTHLPYSFCDPFVPATRYHRCRWVVAIIQRRCVLRSPPGCSLCFALCAMKRR